MSKIAFHCYYFCTSTLPNTFFFYCAAPQGIATVTIPSWELKKKEKKTYIQIDKPWPRVKTLGIKNRIEKKERRKKTHSPHSQFTSFSRGLLDAAAASVLVTGANTGEVTRRGGFAYTVHSLLLVQDSRRRRRWCRVLVEGSSLHPTLWRTYGRVEGRPEVVAGVTAWRRDRVVGRIERREGKGPGKFT